MAERPDSTPFLAQITVPTLVITGSADALIPPAESETLAATIPDAGHLVAFERPVDFNAVLSKWVGQLAG